MLGIKFSHYSQIYYFSCDDPELGPGDWVLAESEQGLGLGLVMTRKDELPAGLSPENVRPVLRRATEQDMDAGRENEQLAIEAGRFCEGRIRERALEMKLVGVETLFDRSKLIFYFTAPMRIDFRELVKDLVREYHTRIELRQIGVRHETQMLGAVGGCGIVCCCRRFLRKFVPVTIKMAKEQNLFLNPSKISGICGRLLCCLSYEQENYDVFHRNCPRLGKRYQTSRGTVKIVRANLFHNSVAFLTEANEEVVVTLDEWQELAPRRPDAPAAPRHGREQARADRGARDDGADPDLPEAFSDERAQDATAFVPEDDRFDPDPDGAAETYGEALRPEGGEAGGDIAGEPAGEPGGDPRRRRRRRKK